MNQIFNSKPKYFRIIQMICMLIAVSSVQIYGLENVPDGMPDNDGIMVIQQQGTVTGKVTDANGEPLPGVSVFLKGTTIGAATGFDGSYTVNVPGRDAILVFSYIGFRTVEMPIGDRRTINVVMQEEIGMLEEVVVVGFGTMERKYITSAISSVPSEKMMQGVGGSDISAAIQGKIGGLVMFNLGSANASTSLQLRGQTSMNAGGDPLIVVDGFPGGDLRSLNLNDIQSIEVLKDASAAAIYGTRASAGVLLITTKSGTETQGQAKVTYNNEFLVKQNYNAPKMLTGREYAAKNIGTDWGNDTDWMKEITNQGNFSQKHDLALSMGTPKTQLRFSFTFEENEGITYNDSRRDFGGRFNVNFKLFDDWFEIRPNIFYRMSNQIDNKPDFAQSLRNNPTRSPYDPKSPTGYNVWLNESHDFNTLANSMLLDWNRKRTYFTGEVTMKLNVKAIPGLTIQQTVGYMSNPYETYQYSSKYRQSEIENNRAGSATINYDKRETMSSQGYATYVQSLGEGKHYINVTAGYDYFEENNLSFSMTNRDFSVDGVKMWNMGNGRHLALGSASMSSNKDVTYRLLAGIFRANYSFDEKYLIQATLRREGSSKFAEAHRWGNFWSVSGGWRISKEPFIKDLALINDLKLRVAYGVTGNGDFNGTYMANLLGSDTAWPLPNGSWAQSYGKTQNVNPLLGWEETKQWNFGLDFSLFDNRIFGKFEYFTKITDNLLFSVTVPQPPYTQGSQWQNIGKMDGHGWEFELGSDVIKNRDLKWSTSFTMFTYSDVLTTLYGNNTVIDGGGFNAPGTPGNNRRMQEGTKFGTFWMWKFAGFDADGRFLLVDRNGEIIPATKKSTLDKQFMGNYIPDLFVSWNNNLQYKNWDLDVSMRSWVGHDVFNSIDMYFGIQGQGNLNVLQSTYTKHDQVRGEKQICDYYLEDGTFLKIDAITLGYTLPMKRFTRMIENIRIFGTIGNVYTFTKYGGMNPEVRISGSPSTILGTEVYWDTGRFYPLVRTFALGTRFNF